MDATPIQKQPRTADAQQLNGVPDSLSAVWTRSAEVCPLQRLVRHKRPHFRIPLRVRPSEYLMSVILQPCAVFDSKNTIFSLVSMFLKDAATSAESFCSATSATEKSTGLLSRPYTRSRHIERAPLYPVHYCERQ